MSGGEIYIEINPVGSALEIVAIDSETATEVRFIAPKDASESAIKSLAQSKMRYVLTKAAAKAVSQKPSGGSRGGIIV